MNFQAMGNFLPITAPYFPLVSNHTEFWQVTVWRTVEWLTPPTLSDCLTVDGDKEGDKEGDGEEEKW